MTVSQFCQLPLVAKQLAIKNVIELATEIALATNAKPGEALWATIPNDEAMEG
jgi:hypothetical protein